MPDLRDLDFSLLDLLPVTVTVHDHEGRFVFVNRAVRVLPAVPEGILRGDPLLAFVAPAMRSNVRRRIADALAHAKPARLSIVLEDPRAPERRLAVAAEVIPIVVDGRAIGFLGITYRDGDPEQILAESAAPLHLTRRQQEILALLVKGRTTEDIGKTLHITPSAVRNHVHNVLARLGVRTRAEAVEAARRRGLVPPQPVRPVDVPPLRPAYPASRSTSHASERG